MSRWKDSDAWSYWVCAHKDCQAEHFDPDTVKVTTCANGHTNYLGPPSDSQWRRAYATAGERAKDLRSRKLMCKVLNDAFTAGRKKIEREEKRKARL